MTNTNTAFTYYRRAYEVQFDAATQTGTLNWKDGLYDESVAFYKLNGAVMFRAKGKMANGVNKKMSSNKEAFLKARIEEVYEAAAEEQAEANEVAAAEEQAEANEVAADAIISHNQAGDSSMNNQEQIQNHLDRVERIELKIGEWRAVARQALIARERGSYDAAQAEIKVLQAQIHLEHAKVDALLKATDAGLEVPEGMVDEVADLASGLLANATDDERLTYHKLTQQTDAEYFAETGQDRQAIMNMLRLSWGLRDIG